MTELSSNPRARSASLYRMRSVHALEETSSCPHLEAGEHIDAHRDELYGMLAVLCNEGLVESLSLKDKRGRYGLLAPGLRAARELPTERYLIRALTATLENDAANIQDKYPELVLECDRYIFHLHSMSDKTMRTSLSSMMRGGIHTAVAVMDMTYKTLSEDFEINSDGLKSSWKSIYEQTRLGIKELIVLPVSASAAETRSAVFEVDDTNIAKFCIAGLRPTEGIQNIADRTTIGCPISFEPALVREVWEWYVDLRLQVGKG